MKNDWNYLGCGYITEALNTIYTYAAKVLDIGVPTVSAVRERASAACSNAIKE
jgi:hypothetical protein